MSTNLRWMWSVARKELLDIGRDRRTLFMALLLGPLLGMALLLGQERFLSFGGDVDAIVLGGVLAGISGALYTLHLGTISPAMIGVAFSIELVVWVALGGRASLWGAAGGMILGLLVGAALAACVALACRLSQP